MGTTATRRLPGIRFEGRPRALDAALPRMDVAAFVGFAARGPLHLPVPIEGPEEFQEVFGNDLRLAWDRVHGRWANAHLAAAVRAFFANGGVRCWVVRVAGPNAFTNRFRLPGLVRAVRTDSGWVLTAATARARSAGSWSDELRACTRLQSRPAQVTIARVPVSGDGLELELRASPPAAAGDLLRVVAADGVRQAFLPLKELVALRNDGASLLSVVRASQALLLPASGASPQDAVLASFEWPKTRCDILSFDLRVTGLPGRPESDIASFDLRVAGPQARPEQLDGLGFVPGRPRYWNVLTTDAELYSAGTARSGLAGQRFPLAGDGEGDPGFFLPLDMSGLYMSGLFDEESQREPDNRSGLERDGLDQFSAALFVDPDLRNRTRATLLEQADYLRYRSPLPRRLLGVHSLLGWNDPAVSDEVTVLAVPDAMHRGWQREEDTLPGKWFVVLEEQPASTPAATATFADCASPLLPKLTWQNPEFTAAKRTLRLQWSPAPANADLQYRIEECALQDFAVPDSSLAVASPELDCPGREPGEAFFRVRAECQQWAGAWSAILRVQLPSRHEFSLCALDEKSSTPALLPVHGALLDMAAARGDLVALLALPEDWRENEALLHARQLAERDAEDHDPSTGSFGALYHPWVCMAAPGTPQPLAVPPDGVAAGILARRARQRGAWVAPANEALRNVVALTPRLLPQRWLDLQEARVNVLRREPAFFTILSADTLAGEPELRPLQVRRLLILLRRLALRIGAEFVFEPQGEALWGAVQRRFERALDDLFRRGAFAGGKPEDAFQVVVRSAAKRAGEVDEGRLVVELRVRPAQALRFITVRLTQSGSGAAVTEVF